jgi:hypothetical protein
MYFWQYILVGQKLACMYFVFVPNSYQQEVRLFFAAHEGPRFEPAYRQTYIRTIVAYPFKQGDQMNW